MKLISEILEAERRIRPFIHHTALLQSKPLTAMIAGKVFLKLENEQHTGSFKARGSLNKLLSLSDKELQQGMVTASTGNHAQGFARACEIAKANGTIFLPKTASASKVDALKYYDVNLEFYGDDSLTTEVHAKQYAADQHKVWVSPYDDLQVIAGQGTIGIELLQDLDHIDQVFITVGGGGLISGVASYLKHHKPDIKIIACQPKNSPEMSLSVEAGHIVNLEESVPTLSDGSAGGIEHGAMTFPICQSVIDEFVLIEEQQIIEAIKLIAHKHHKIIEGAAGVAVAGLLAKRKVSAGRTSVVIICGGNIDLEKFKTII